MRPGALETVPAWIANRAELPGCTRIGQDDAVRRTIAIAVLVGAAAAFGALMASVATD